MKIKSPVIEFYRVTRWKKHLKDVSKKRKKNERRLQNLRNKTLELQKGDTHHEKLHYEAARLTNEFELLCKNCNTPSKRTLRKQKVKFRIPKEFDIYESPESVLKTVADFRELALNKSIKSMRVIHNSIDTCMSSEALLGILGAEIDEFRSSNDDDMHMDGHIYHTASNSALIENTGIVAELNSGEVVGKRTSSSSEVFLFTKDNKQFDSASLSAEDIKNETAEGCIDQLSQGLRKLLLELNKDTEDDLKMSLGEILDNAQEHCYRTAPTWYLRAYLNTNKQHERYFELMVMNIGTTISDTFKNLVDSSDVKKDAQSYAAAHSHLFEEDALITVAALQGNVSSKKDQEKTRGQGTIRLIETFENISRDYVKLRGKGKQIKKNEPIMNIISGNTIITFDGKYKSHTIEHGGGAEDVRISFNNEKSLRYPPDSSNVRSMTKAYFPGVMINIRIPLNGSTTPLEDDTKGAN